MCTTGRDPQLGQLRWGLGGHWSLVTEVITPDTAPLIINKDFTITEKAPTRAFSWLKAPTSAFTFKTLLTITTLC